MRHTLFFLLFLALTACGQKGPETTSAPSAADPARDIRLTATAQAQSAFDRARAEFLTDAILRTGTLTDPRHAPLLLDHGRPTAFVAVITPGLYDSPYFQRRLAETLHRAGMNVIVGLLPGHWAADRFEIDRADYTQYLREQRALVATAKKLGSQLVLAGHSTGALLAFQSAMEEKSAAAMVLAAPAFELTRAVKIGISLGQAFNLSANPFIGYPDGKKIPYVSARAGAEVLRLIKVNRSRGGWEKNRAPRGETDESVYRRFFQNVEIPVMVITSDHDYVVRSDIAQLLAENASGPKRWVRSAYLDHQEVGRFFPRDHADEEVESMRILGEVDSFLREELGL